MLNLRDGFDVPANQRLNFATPEAVEAYSNLDAAGASQFGRGWTSAGYSGRAGDYANEAVQAGLRGDGLRAAYLKQLAQDEAARAEVWAPTTRSFTDIDSVGSALDWAGGALGNIRTSVAPMVGGVVGAGLGAGAGAVAAPFTAGVINPITGAMIGGRLGSAIPAYQMEKGETAAGALLDPNNTASYEDIDRAGMAKGAINAGLEALVPFGVARSLAGLGKAVAKGEAKKHLGREVAKNAGEEFLTEGAQSLVGQGAENYLKGEDLTDFDYKQAFNEGMAGAVAGGGMGLVGGAADVAHTQFGKGVDKAKDFAANPMEKVGDAVADIGGKVGNYFGNKKDDTEKEVDRLMKLSDEDFLEATMPKRPQSAADALREDERDLDDKSLVAKRNAEARTEAEEILKAPPRTYSSDVVAAANDVVVGRGDAIKLRDALRDQKAFDDADDMLRALEGGETKKSLMRPTLTDDFGEQEGRDMSQDSVTDNRGNIVRGNKNPDVYSAQSVDQKQKGEAGITTGKHLAPHVYGQATDAINQSKTASQTPYAGDSFEYDSAPALKHTDKSELTFNYDSIQRSAGILVAKKAESAGVGARVAYHIERQRRRESGKNVAAAESVKDEAQKTLDLAAILIKDRFDNYGKESGKASVKAAQSIGTRTAELQKVAGMITWARYGFQREAEAVQAIGDVFGAEGEALFNQAYGAGVQEGLIPRNPAKAAEIATKLRNAVLSNEQRRAAVVENLRPTLRHRATPDVVKELVAKLEDIVKNGMRGENITKGGNTKSRQGDLFNARSATDQRVLETLFGDEEHIAAALRPIIIAHENAQIGKSRDDVVEKDFEVDVDHLDDQESVVFDKADRRDAAMSEVKSQSADHFKGDNGFFDLKNLEDKTAFNKLKAEKEAVGKSDAVEGRAVGIVDHALEQAAAEKGSDLTDKQRFKVLQKLVHQYNRGLVKLASLPKHANQVTRKDHEKRKAEYERLIESKARQLNAQHVMLRTTTTAAERPAFEFSEADIEDLEVDRDLRKAANGIGRGTILFERTGEGGRQLKKPFVTSAPMLLRKMYERQGEEGFKHLKGEQAGGSAHTIHSLLMDGVSSLISAGGFSGRVGYPGPDGEPVWLKGGQDFPANMLVLNGNETKKSPPRFYGEVKADHTTLNAVPEYVFDGDLSDFGSRTVQRSVETTIDKVFALSDLANNEKLVDSEEAGKLKALVINFWSLMKTKVADLPAGKAMIKRLNHEFKTLINAKASADEKLAASKKIEDLTKAKLIDLPEGEEKLSALVEKIDDTFNVWFPDGKTFTELRNGNGKLEEGQRGENRLSDADPASLPRRTERGLPDTADVTMVAASFTGRTVDPTKQRENAAKTDTGPLATKKTPDRTSGNEDSYVAPMDSHVHAAAVKQLNAVGRKIVGLTNDQIDIVNAVIRANPLVKQAVGYGYISHVVIDENMAKFGDAGRVWALDVEYSKDGGTYITTHQVLGLSPKLFDKNTPHVDKMRSYVFAHEVGHTMQDFVALDKFSATGEIAQLARALPADSWVRGELKLPLDKDNLKTGEFERELHAQLFAIVSEKNARETLADESPELFNIMKGLYGQNGTFAQSLFRTDFALGGRSDEGVETSSKEKQLVEGNPVESDGEGRDQSGGAGGLPEKLSNGIKQKLIRQLSTVIPRNKEHAAAIKHALAVLKGEKEGYLPTTLGRVFEASEYLGKMKERRTLNLTKQDSEVAEEIPEYISDYEEEYGFDPEQAEMDAAMFEEGDPGYDEAALQRHQVDPDRFEGEGEPLAEVKEATPAEQLQAYIDQHAGKNKFWEGTARKALAENKATQINGALAAAKKQFGELSPSATPVAQPVSQSEPLTAYERRVEANKVKATNALAAWSKNNSDNPSQNAGVGADASWNQHNDSTPFEQNLVDAAKPPAFAREKEQAKLDGADYVFAPQGVSGSFASRLADAAKAAGKLINPNGTENIRDKVVYISVPGANRGFTGIEGFIADVRKLLDRGAIIRTDTKERAGTPHNAAGEGRLRQMLAFGNYVLTEGSHFDSWQKNLPRVKNEPVSQPLRPAGTRDGEEALAEVVVGNLRIQEGEFNTWLNGEKINHETDEGSEKINRIVFDAVTAPSSIIERAKLVAALRKATADPINYGSNREFLMHEMFEEDVRAELKAMHVRQDLIDDLFDPRYADDAADTIVDQLGSFEGDAAEIEARQGKLFNKQQAAGKPTDKAAQDKVNAFLHKVLGDKVKVEFVDAFSDGSSGEWEASDTGTVIRIALNGDVMGTGFHEAIHDLFNMLRNNGGEKIIKQLERAAMSPLMQKRLERMLDGHPEAIEQLAKPEEAVAFMFQFWMLDPSGFNIGPETKTFFQKVKDFISKIVGIFSESTRGELMKRAAEDSKAEMTQLLLKTFAEGHFGNVENRQAVIDALNGKVEKHEAAMRHIGESVTRLWDVLNSKAGHLAMTAEGVIEATNNDYWKSLSLDFHQKAGTAMRTGWFGGRGGYSEAVRSETNKRMVHLERELKGVDQADLELARKHLSEGTVPDAKEAKRIHGILRDYLDDFQKYIAERKVTRLEQNQATKEYVWVPIQFRKDYWPQVFNVDAVLKDVEQFKVDLLQHHRKQLEAIAKEANAAVKAKRPDGAASKAQLAAATQQNITPEMIAEEILSNVVNRNQLKDIGETEGQLGITPAAAAVNRRTLDWLDMEVFDKYMDKDVVNILSTYTNSMVKRAEAQARFGNGGERVQEQMDRGLLYEMGGNDLVEKAEAKLPGAIDGWKTRAAQYYEDYSGKEVPTPFSQIEPFPTLRSVGTTVHRAMVGKDQYLIDLQAAAKKAQGVEKAIMGMEGTLGRDISPNARALSSWVTTYQNFRTLSLSLFQSFSDVMGVVREGGEFTDAWDTFVMGMREVRNTWKKELSEDPRFLRAEEWGAVDAGAAMESYGQMNNSVFMTGKAKALSDWFFRFNGMEGWNRGTRALAANVAERIITKWAKEGIDTNDKAAVARFERLYGAGAKTKHIKLDADGRLDINDLDNRAAVNRWVLDAIATPNGAIKALHANDPHYSTFYHLKNFSYAMHRVALKGAVAQARLGNYRPAAVLASGYIPIIIAANAVKEMLIPGDEPPWMQKGLGGWLGYGWDRAGLLGVPQMYAQNLFDADPAAVFGPSVDQIQNILSIPVPEIKVDLPGFDPMTLHKDHTLLGEGFGSLPFGNVLRRLEKLAT